MSGGMSVCGPTTVVMHVMVVGTIVPRMVGALAQDPLCASPTCRCDPGTTPSKRYEWKQRLERSTESIEVPDSALGAVHDPRVLVPGVNVLTHTGFAFRDSDVKSIADQQLSPATGNVLAAPHSIA